MSAVSVPSMESVKKALVAKFKEDYAASLADARVSAEHTATEGWRQLYLMHKRNQAAQRSAMAREMREHAQSLESFGWTEDTEKAVKELAKQSAELRAADSLFERKFISKIVEPIRSCERIIQKYQGDAQREEQSSPLVAAGTAALMSKAIDDVERVEWDEATGVVSIK